MSEMTRRPCTGSTRACDFWTWGNDSVRPECCTEHLLELLGLTSDLLARHGIVHWLDYGSLPGAVRDEKLIAWDADGDFGILKHDEPAVLALADEIAAVGHRLDASMQGVIRLHYSDVNATPVDLFLWEARDGMLLPLEDTDYAWPGMASRLAFPERLIAPLGEVSLHGRRFPASKSVHEFLRDHRYGPSYAVPARPVRSIRLYPSFDIEESTLEIEHLIARLAAGDWRLAQLRSASRWSHSRAVEVSQKGRAADLPESLPRQHAGCSSRRRSPDGDDRKPLEVGRPGRAGDRRAGASLSWACDPPGGATDATRRRGVGSPPAPPPTQGRLPVWCRDHIAAPVRATPWPHPLATDRPGDCACSC